MKIEIVDQVNFFSEIETERTILEIADFDIAAQAIPKSIILAAGDLIVGAGAGIAARLAGVPDGYILVRDSSQALGWRMEEHTTYTVREILQTDRTYYVRTDGNDNNDGLTNDAAGAFLTIQKAVDTIAELDINAKNVTVQVADGTYTAPVILKNVPGFAAPGNLTINGNISNHSAVTISLTTGQCIEAVSIQTVWKVNYIKVTSAAGAGGLIRVQAAELQIDSLVFGNAPGSHIFVTGKGILRITTGYKIAGSATSMHMWIQSGSVFCSAITVTFLASVSFHTWMRAQYLTNVDSYSITYSFGGFTATGTRYLAAENSVIFTNGGGASYFPGTVAGSVANGGIYL